MRRPRELSLRARLMLVSVIALTAMHKVPTDKAASAEAVKFFGWAFDKGGKMAEELDYIPMPANVIDLIKKTWNADVKAM